MPLMHCPHCGAKNFTMEGWEDLDHCSSCGKPLGEQEASSADVGERATRIGEKPNGLRNVGQNGRNAEKPRPA
jgi:hypothetical protein